MLFSAVSDKQYEAMLEALLISGLFTCLFLTRLQTDRTLDRDRMERLYEQAKHSGIQVVLCKDVQEALKTMQGERGPKDTSFAAGSLYLVSEVLKITGAQSND